MTLIQALSVIFLIIGLGIFCKKRNILTHVHSEGFEIFLFKIAMPSYLFISTLQHDLSALMNLRYMVGYLATFFFVAMIVVLIFYKVSSGPVLCIKILASSYVNAAIYSLPIITFLLKDPTAGILASLLQVGIIQLFFVVILNVILHKEKTITEKLFKIILNPLIVMPILGLIFNYLCIDLPTIFVQTAQGLGNGAASFALFAFGLNLGGVTITKKDIDKDLIIIVFIKNILHPVIAFYIGKYVLNLEFYWLASLVISSSASTAFIVLFIAKQFSVEQDFVRKVVAISSCISLISLVFIAFILNFL